MFTQLNNQTVLFQTIQFSWSTKLNGSKYCYVSLTIQLNISDLFTQLNDQTILFLTIQFVCTQFECESSIWPIDRTLSGATTPGQSEFESNSNEEVLHILEISKTAASPIECLMLYLGHTFFWWGSYPLCRDAVDVFYSPSRLGCPGRSGGKVRVALTPLLNWSLTMQFSVICRILPFGGGLTLLKVMQSAYSKPHRQGCYFTIQYSIYNNLSIFCKNIILKLETLKINQPLSS